PDERPFLLAARLAQTAAARSARRARQCTSSMRPPTSTRRPAMHQGPYRSLQSGSLQRAADRIRRILEREERQQAGKVMTSSAASEPNREPDFLDARFPAGSTGWAAQKIRRILDREEGFTPIADAPSSPSTGSEIEQDNRYGYMDLAWDAARQLLDGEI